MLCGYKQVPNHENIDLKEVTTDPQPSTEITPDQFHTFKQQVIANQIEQISLITKQILNHLDNDLHKPILTLSCQAQGDFANVTATTVSLLIEKGAKIDHVDQKWYGWEAVHYAAFASEPEKLAVLCSKLGETRINTLTMLSENVLHVLLDHGRLAKSFDISCQNGPDLKMSKIISKEQKRVVDCVKILIDAKIDINHSNFWNETPILIAIKRKYFEVVKLLLQVDGVDLDSCRGAVTGKTARELLKGKEAEFKLLPKFCGTILPGKVLFQLLKSGDEEEFLKYRAGKIADLVHTLDGDSKDNSSCTLLQYCFRRGLIAWYQEKKRDCDLYMHYQDITANRLVQVFCQNGMPKCIQHLLDNDADVDVSLVKFENGRALLEVAITKGYYPLVALILGRMDLLKTSPTREKVEQICVAMTELLKNGTNEIDVNNTLSLVLTWLLNVEKPPQITDNLRNVLKQGVRIMNKDNILLLLKFPGFLCEFDLDLKPSRSWLCSNSVANKTVLEEVDPEVLRTHLDECVEQKNGLIYINYNSFIVEDTESCHSTQRRKNENSGTIQKEENSGSKASVLQVLETFVRCEGLNDFLNHVVFKILIMRRWERLRLPYCNMKYFYLNLFYYMTFYSFLNIYILCKFNSEGPEGTIVTMVRLFGYFCFVIFVCKELFQIVVNCFNYITKFNNYVECFFMVVTMMVYTTSTDSQWADGAAVLAVLSSNLVLLLLLERVPKFSRYMIILRTIIFYLSYIVFYFIQFLAFAICFYILFAKSGQVWNHELPNKIFETVILFTGNLDYMETPWTEDSKNCTNSTDTKAFRNFPQKELFSKIIFTIFVLFMALILHNLLLGLLVTDMNELNKSVKLSEQIKRARFVVRLEKYFETSCLKRLPIVLVDKKETDVREIKVDDEDRKTLKSDDDKQYFDFILSKKAKRPDALKKLHRYITAKMRERKFKGERHEINKEVIGKLELIEERIKNLHEMSEILSVYFNKNK